MLAKKQILKISFFLLCIFVFSLLFSTNILAVSFSLTSPQPPFSEGQEVEFIVNIDTQGETLTETQAEMVFDTEYLKYISTSPGEIFPNVTGSITEPGILSLSASVNSGDPGVTGAGTFAVVTFKLIGSPQSDVELCAVTSVTPTPTNPPDTPTDSPPTPTNTPSSQPTPPPIVSPSTTITKLPKSGTMGNVISTALLGLTFTFFGFGLLKAKK